MFQKSITRIVLLKNLLSCMRFKISSPMHSFPTERKNRNINKHGSMRAIPTPLNNRSRRSKLVASDHYFLYTRECCSNSTDARRSSKFTSLSTCTHKWRNWAEIAQMRRRRATLLEPFGQICRLPVLILVV